MGTDTIVGRTVLYCVGDVEYPCTVVYRGDGYALKDQATGREHIFFGEEILRELSMNGNASNMELM